MTLLRRGVLHGGPLFDRPEPSDGSDGVAHTPPTGPPRRRLGLGNSGRLPRFNPKTKGLDREVPLCGCRCRLCTTFPPTPDPGDSRPLLRPSDPRIPFPSSPRTDPRTLTHPSPAHELGTPTSFSPAPHDFMPDPPVLRVRDCSSLISHPSTPQRK